MRLSTYNIYIQTNHANIILNSLWGSIDEIENDVYFSLKNNLLYDISESTRAKLMQRGYLTEFTIEKETDIVKNIIKKYYAKHLELNGGSYTIILSYNCNFRCPYCFEKQIQKKGLNYIKNKMTFNMIDHLCDFIEKNPPKKKCITLYGGEPLMRENKKELKYLIDKLGNKYKLKFISNGFEIADFLNLLNEANTEFIQISLDGDKTFHNKTRKSCTGSESFDIIMNNIISLIEKRINVYLRVNCTSENINHMKELNEALKNYSFYYNSLFSISYSPIIDFSGKKNVKILEMEDFIETIKSLNNYGKSHDFIEGIYIHNHFRNFFKNSFFHRKPLKIQPLACNSYLNTYVLDPFGKIYPCWDIVDEAEHCIGTFYPETTENKHAISIWRNRENVIFEKCIQCPYVLYCGGGCMMKAKLKKGKFDEVECDFFPEIFKTHFKIEYNNWINTL
jgi:uncharacterized protein